MKKTLRQRLIKYFSARPQEVISGGEIERIVVNQTTYKPSNISRRLRELENDGLLKATYERGHVCYQWARAHNVYTTYTPPRQLTLIH